MSLLNMASDGMPNVLLVLYRYLIANGPTPESKLIDVCAPDVVCRQDRVRSTINTWSKLGLLFRQEDEVRLDPTLPAAVRDRKSGEESLRQVLRELVFRSDNNEPFWGSEGARASDFTRGLAWCLAMDPLRLHGNGYDPVNRLELDTLPAELEVFRNDTRWNGFKAWAVFLGFGWQARFPKLGTLVVDPASAMQDAIPAVFGDAVELDRKSFLIALGERLPVLDGGTYRVEVEGNLRREAWTGVGENELSASLSLALLRLQHEGVLDFADRADSTGGRATLTGRGGRQLATVTHFLRSGRRP